MKASAYDSARDQVTPILFSAESSDEFVLGYEGLKLEILRLGCVGLLALAEGIHKQGAS